ncbi:MAG: hypothetical protein ACYDH4_11145, partial [Candidatus Cryosericum sp.]
MSYTPSLNGDVTGPTANDKVVALQNRPMLPTAPLTGQALVWNGAAWAPAAAGTATDALAASLIFRAGGVAGGNVFTTWATLYTAFQSTDGPVTIAIDTAPGGVVTATTVPAGAYNLQGRATIPPCSPRPTTG